MAKSRFAAVLAIVFVAAAGPGIAQQASPEAAIRYLDTDGDGKCSLNEYLTFQAGRIPQFDANSDGMLQYGEFKDSLQGKAKANAQRTFNAFDKEDERNALTRREFLGYHAYVFRTFVDTDNDGFMSAEEWSKIVAQN
jgi:Ca2+-binding EF-hand superfamily protein